MTDQQLILAGGFVLTGLLGLVAFFLRRLLSDHDSTKSKLGQLETRLSELKLSIEQNFVSFDTFETIRNEFRSSLREIYAEQAKQGQILARLDERSQADEKLAAVMTAMTVMGDKVVSALQKGKK